MLSTPCLFLLVLIRIHKPANKFQGLIALLFFTLTLCGSYHTPQAVLNEFPGYLMFYCVVAVVFTWISTTFITPTPSGTMRERPLLWCWVLLGFPRGLMHELMHKQA